MFAKFSIALFLYCCVAVKSVELGSRSGFHRLQCDCGRANERTSKIVGGAVVDEYKYPWMVTVQSERGSFCGGSLITREYVLTAAHCVKYERNIKVGVAVHDRNKPGLGIPASAVKVHPKYNERERGKGQYDIALIKLQRPVRITERVRTLCLPHDMSFERPGKDAIVAGWGRTNPNDANSVSRFLKEANLKIVYANTEITTHGLNRSDVCMGDSGSPLFTKYADGRYHVIGVTSTTQFRPYPCMGVSNYARVSRLNQWIIQNIGDSEPCARASVQILPVETNDL